VHVHDTWCSQAFVYDCVCVDCMTQVALVCVHILDVCVCVQARKHA